MQETITVIQTLGFPIAVAIACGWFIYKIISRDKDEAKAREDKACDMIGKLSDALDKSSDAINESTRVNSSLTETNRMMATEIKVSLDKILDKVSGK